VYQADRVVIPRHLYYFLLRQQGEHRPIHLQERANGHVVDGMHGSNDISLDDLPTCLEEGTREMGAFSDGNGGRSMALLISYSVNTSSRP
jgi:hypothetical protein